MSESTSPKLPEPSIAAARRQLVLHLSIIFATGFLAYSNSFFAPFVFDDRHTIVENPAIRHLSRFFVDPELFLSIPRRFLGYFTFAVNYRIGGMDVFGYHLFNLIVHISTAILLYFLCRLLFKAGLPEDGYDNSSAGHAPLIASLLFVAHPVHTQAVTYITQRFALLAAFFYLLAVVLYLLARLSRTACRRGLCYGLSLLASVLAMLSKEIAFTLPFAIILLEFMFFRTAIRRRIILLTPFLATLFLIPLLIVVTGRHEPELHALWRDICNYMITQIAVVATYVRLLFLPFDQRLDYDYPVFNNLYEPRVLLGGFVIICLCVSVGLLLKRSRADGGFPSGIAAKVSSFGICWFLITLTVESVVPLSDVINEHRLYLPSIGAALIAGVFLSHLSTRFSLRFFAATIGFIVFVSAVATWKRNLVWGDELLLWSDSVAKSPGKARPHYNLGTILSRRGGLDAAEIEFQTALEIDTKHASARYNLGVIYAVRGDSKTALLFYEEAIRIDPALAEAHNSIGTLYSAEGKLDKAITAYREAIRLNPNLADPHNNLGAALGAKGDLDTAIAEILIAIKMAPENPAYRENLAKAYELKGRKPY